MFNFLIAIAWFAVASYYDLKTREIHPALPYSLMAIGAIYSYLYGSILTTAEVVAATFVFSYILYRLKVWAGGDVKLFTALAFILPVASYPFYPFVVLAASLFLTFPIMILYVAYNIMIRKKAVHELGTSIKTGLRKTMLSIIALSIVYLVVHQQFNTLDFFYILLTSIIVAFGIESFRVARKHFLVETVKKKDVKEGMILARDVMVNGKRISTLAAGLTKQQVSQIKRSKIKQIAVRKSIPFVPVLTFGLLILYILETLLY